MAFYRCPACGYSGLKSPPHNPVSGGASDEICPCCGFQFGFDDDDRHISYEEWRVQWVSNGMRWFSAGQNPPDNWDAASQVRALESDL